MPSLFTRCTGVYMQAIDPFIVNHFQNMRVPANKQLWGLSVNELFNLRAVFSGVAANMCHPYIYVLTIKAQIFGVLQTDLFPINIAVNTPQRLKRGKFIGKFYSTKIAGM